MAKKSFPFSTKGKGKPMGSGVNTPPGNKRPPPMPFKKGGK